MSAYFIWKGTSSQSYTGLWITQLPGIARPEERVKYTKIPGKAGDVTTTEGDQIFNSYLRECVVTVSNSVDFEGLTSWLQGSGTVVFSNESNREYTARISSAILFDRISNDLRQATIPFYCQPYKMQTPKESNISVTADTTITNPGNVKSKPIVVLNGTGEASLKIGDREMSFTNLPGILRIDCDAEMFTVLDGVWDDAWEGEYFRIAPGNNAVEIDGCTAVITPEWRWV